MDRPDEIDVVAVAGFHQFADVLRLFFRVGLPPVRAAVVGVVFGAVEIAVHLEPAVEVDERKPHCVGPGRAVKPFDHAAQRQVGIVVDLQVGQALASLRPDNRAFGDLPQGLDSIEDAPLVVSGDGDSLFADIQRIGSRHGFHAGFGGRFRAEVCGEFNPFLTGGQDSADLFGEFSLFLCQAYPAGEVERAVGIEGQAVRRGIDNKTFVVQFLSGDHQHVLRFRPLRGEVESVVFLSRKGTANQQTGCQGGQQSALLCHCRTVYGLVFISVAGLCVRRCFVFAKIAF